MTKSVQRTSDFGLMLLAATLLSLRQAAAAPVPSTTGSQTGLIIAGILLLIFGGLGAYMVYSGIKSRANARASETWPTAGGTVLASEVEQRAHYSHKTRKTTYDYEPKIRYRYKVAGTDYESDVIRFGDLVRNSAKLPEELVAKYPAGSTVAVRYDSADPKCRRSNPYRPEGSKSSWGLCSLPSRSSSWSSPQSHRSWRQQSGLPPHAVEPSNAPNRKRAA